MNLDNFDNIYRFLLAEITKGQYVSITITVNIDKQDELLDWFNTIGVHVINLHSALSRADKCNLECLNKVPVLLCDNMCWMPKNTAMLYKLAWN